MPSKWEMAELGWGDPDDPNFYEKHITRLEQDGVVIYCHRVIRPIFRNLIFELDKLGANLDQHKDDWGYANKDIEGYPGVKSYHAWGIAIDLDATEQPMGIYRTTFPAYKTKRLAENLGLTWGYIWGAMGYRPDAMHFEFRGSKTQCRYRAAKLRRRG